MRCLGPRAIHAVPSCRSTVHHRVLATRREAPRGAADVRTVHSSSEGARARGDVRSRGRAAGHRMSGALERGSDPRLPRLPPGRRSGRSSALREAARSTRACGSVGFPEPPRVASSPPGRPDSCPEALCLSWRRPRFLPCLGSGPGTHGKAPPIAALRGGPWTTATGSQGQRPCNDSATPRHSGDFFPPFVALR